MFQALLLAAGTLVRAASDDETKGGRYAHFNGMFFMVVFVAAVFLVGKVTGALGAPRSQPSRTQCRWFLFHQWYQDFYLRR